MRLDAIGLDGVGWGGVGFHGVGLDRMVSSYLCCVRMSSDVGCKLVSFLAGCWWYCNFFML